MTPAQRVVLFTGLYAAAAGFVSFSGWFADVPLLTDWDNDGISIQPNATVAAMAAGVAPSGSPWR